MAAAAYAALVSLLNTMDLVQNHPLLSTCFDKCHNESLREKVDFLVDFMENHSDADSEEAEDLVRRIAVVAREAEDLIEVHAADRIRASSTQQCPSFLPDLQKVIEDMDSVKENVIKVKEETGFITRSSVLPPSSSAPPATAKTTTMVGFEGYLEQLLDELTGQHSGRRILPIVGMGGIGKTTLARNAYENSLTAYHFDVRAWVIVSQEYSAREILLQALSCLGRSASKIDRTDDQLGEELYKILSGRRYLVVLDDVWSIQAWEKIKFFCPENNNGSRIVVTTRQSEVVNYFGSSALVVKFLDKRNSWELFCDKTFSKEGCPPELEQVGKKIVKKCRGLPLAIIVIGGLLGKSPRNQEYWEKIAKDKSLIFDSEEGNNSLSVLYLSYKYMRIWLKSCFLYLGLFPEDHEIDVPQLIKLWVGEGFIKSKTEQSLEEVAESYIEDFVDRNLLSVVDLRPYGRYLRSHDLVRDMCIRTAEKEKYFFVQRDVDGMREFIVDETTARFYPHTPSETLPSIVCPLILEGQRAAPFKSRLLRVLYSVDRDRTQLDSTFRQLNLRFLCYTSPAHSLPSSISLLWSLQTLISSSSVVAPLEIWEMPQLRHIEMRSLCVPDPPPSDDVIVLQNLQTLERVENLILSEEVCKRIPNIKKLGIQYKVNKQGGEASWCNYHLQNVGWLDKLESLDCSCIENEYARDSLRKNLKLPSSLKELSLDGCKLVWSDMTTIASLPHLQILRLRSNAVVGPEWKCVEEQFLCLKFLIVFGCADLIKWNAESSNFPVLEQLYLGFLSNLEEIPSGIGEIPTLREMELFDCNESAGISAVEILEEQESLGNQGLQLKLVSFGKTKANMWREKIQELGFTSQNLHISYYGVEDTY